MKFHIEYVKKEIPGAKQYIGMNAPAAEELHIPFKHKHPAHTVVTIHSLRPSERRSTIRHEEAENYLMRVKHMHYPKAHHLALQYEKLHKPFSIKGVNGLLKKK
jgi:hypothetical protein